MKKIVVFGAGMVGSTIAADLSSDYDVTAVDLSEENLYELQKKKIKTIRADFNDKNRMREIAVENDLSIGAVPGFMGYEFLKNLILCGVNVVDISFFPEDAFDLDGMAKAGKVTAVVDCGVAPGMSNFILGYHNKRMKVENFECYVGGLPFEREFPFQYKAPFSPIDVIEEYTRPARIVVNGKVVVKEPLSEPELVNFEKIGMLEAFNTDGLRTLLKTMKISNMKEKTLRYQGHIEYIQVLINIGLFSHEPLEIDGVKVKPINLTSKLLFDKWKLGKEDDEFTIMRVIIEGMENNIKKKYIYDLFDRFDPITKTSSMARSTGYTAAAVANLVINGRFTKKGISPPEYIGEDESLFNDVLSYLIDRDVIYRTKAEQS